MSFAPKLEMRQGQQLVMTPQLQQAIRLLQFSNMELTAYVETELERNPLLEREEGDDTPEPQRNDDWDDAPPAAEGLALDLQAPATEAHEAFDTAFENVFPEATPNDGGSQSAQPGQTSGWETVRQSTHNDGGTGENNFEDYVAAEVSLKDHLTAQVNLAVTDTVERFVALHLVDMVDEAGYIQGDLAQLADKLGAPVTLVDTVLTRLQTLDPVGVFARSLAECLALQLKEQNRFDPLMEKLVDNLPLLAGHNIAALRRAVGVDDEDLADMIQELKRLNPKPGLKFGSVQMQPVVPDVIVRAASNGSWSIELNSETLPRVLVNRSYYTVVAKTARNEQDKGYLLECLQNANWLVKSLDQRARTILRVAEEIIRQQDAFLTHGVQHLRPLNLKSIADKISMHESTVSRVTSNKFMATPRGIYELKYFFTSAIQSADSGGDAFSSEAVRHRIKTMIDAESPAAILSDDKIVEKLKADGIDIARRTVAKYREAMRISSSVQRRREKQMAAKLGRMAEAV
jgi:RNA polymerase sigma-54 factor